MKVDVDQKTPKLLFTKNTAIDGWLSEAFTSKEDKKLDAILPLSVHLSNNRQKSKQGNLNPIGRF